MKIRIETYEDGAAAVRTSSNGFVPFGNEADARTFANGVKAGYDQAIYNARRAGLNVGDLERATIET